MFRPPVMMAQLPMFRLPKPPSTECRTVSVTRNVSSRASRFSCPLIHDRNRSAGLVLSWAPAGPDENRNTARIRHPTNLER